MMLAIKTSYKLTVKYVVFQHVRGKRMDDKHGSRAIYMLPGWMSWQAFHNHTLLAVVFQTFSHFLCHDKHSKVSLGSVIFIVLLYRPFMSEGPYMDTLYIVYFINTWLMKRGKLPTIYAKNEKVNSVTTFFPRILIIMK